MSGTQSKIFSFQSSFSVAENILRMVEHPCKLAQSCGFLKCLLMSASFHSNNFRIRLHYGYMPNLFFFWFGKYSGLPRWFSYIKFLLTAFCQIHLYCFEFRLRMFIEVYSEPCPTPEFWIRFWFIVAPHLQLPKYKLYWYTMTAFTSY